MTTPTPRSLLLLLAGFPVALLPALVSGRLWPFWVVFLGLSALAIGVDAILCLPTRRLTVVPKLPGLLYIGGEGEVTVTISLDGRFAPARADVRCEVNDVLQVPPPGLLRLRSGRRNEVKIPLVPNRRGRGTLDQLWLRWYGPFGLIRRAMVVRCDDGVTVVPNTKGVRTLALQLFSNREFMTGLKRQKFIGDGSEFESLREYTPGLDHRAIDWKASARHVKLLCREYRAERNHQVLLCFDTGHLMSEPTEGIPKIDHAINAGLLLGYVCLKTGDRVGTFAFDREVGSFAPPRGGMGTFHHLQHFSSGLAYGTGETNFTLAMTELMTRTRRRSLVVVFTEFVDTVTAELMIENVRRLGKRHLVIFVTFRDATLDALVNDEPDDLVELNRAVVAADFINERQVVLTRLRRHGIHVIEAGTKDMPARVINRYLEIKRREAV